VPTDCTEPLISVAPLDAGRRTKLDGYVVETRGGGILSPRT
jgi:hypothetical protein